MQSVMDSTGEARTPQRGHLGWRSMLSSKGLTTIIAVGTVVLVLLAAATLIVMLL